MALARAQAALPAFRAACAAAGQTERASSLLRELKVTLTELAVGDAAAEDVTRQVLELAVLLSVREGDSKAFERNVAQLKPFLAGVGDDGPQAEARRHVLGLLLLHLLTEARLAEFHNEVEQLRPGDRAAATIAFPLQLETYLMGGSYNKILAARGQVPSEHYAPFMARLAGTVREQIADCAAAAYKSLSVAAAQKMMMFESAAELASYLREHRPEWSVQGGTIHFGAEGGGGGRLLPASSSKRGEVDPQQLIANALAYAVEIERIV